MRFRSFRFKGFRLGVQAPADLGHWPSHRVWFGKDSSTEMLYKCKRLDSENRGSFLNGFL